MESNWSGVTAALTCTDVYVSREKYRYKPICNVASLTRRQWAFSPLKVRFGVLSQHLLLHCLYSTRNSKNSLQSPSSLSFCMWLLWLVTGTGFNWRAGVLWACQQADFSMTPFTWTNNKWVEYRINLLSTFHMVHIHWVEPVSRMLVRLTVRTGIRPGLIRPLAHA